MDNKKQDASQESYAIGSEVGKKIFCSMCNKEGEVGNFTTLQNHKGEPVYLCSECKLKANEAFEVETQNPNITLGIIAGIVGAIIGGLVWYFVAVFTGREIGYISLGLGYLVGMGVHLGSGKKTGHKLQIISAVIAIIAIFVTEKYIFDYFLNQYIQLNINEFPEMVDQTVSVPFFYPDFLKGLLSPIGLLIYAIGIYFAYKVCKPRSLNN